MSRKKISTTIYVTPEQSEKLKLLHERTKVSMAEYIRQGIDLVLRHHSHLLPGQLALETAERERPSRRNASAAADNDELKELRRDVRASSQASGGEVAAKK